MDKQIIFIRVDFILGLISTIIVIPLILLIPGCLGFGGDIELSGKDVDSGIIENVTKITGVVFPEETKGKHYIYLGSGFDPCLALKVSIPADKKDVFLKNTIFISGKNKEPKVDLWKGKNWWKVKSMTDPVHTVYNCPDGDLIECSVGGESDETIVYLTWCSI